MSTSKRQRRPRGHIEQRGPDSFRLWVPLRPLPNGKYEYYRESFRGTREEAKARHTELLHMRDTGRLATGGNIPFEHYLRSWLDDNEPNWSYTTHREYKRVAENHIIPALGSLPLSKITPLHIQKFYGSLQKDGARKDKKAGPLSAGTIRQIHAIVHGSLGDAVDPLKLITTNPASGAKIPKINDQERRRKRRLWTEAQLDFFIERIQGHKHEALLLTFATTGMRTGEILALKWLNVDFESRVFNLEEGLKRAGRNPIYGPTKGRQERVIPIDDILYPSLREHRRRMLEVKLALGPDWNPDDLVFPSEAGTPIFHSNLRQRVWIPTLDEINAWARAHKMPELPYINLHGFRHTFGTIGAKVMDVAALRDIMGHHSAAFTQDEYVTHNLEHLRSAVSAFSRRVRGTQ